MKNCRRHSLSYRILVASFLIMGLCWAPLQAQTVIGGTTPDASAMLDVISTGKGVLIPRIADPASVATPATGLIIFNTTLNCIQVNEGTPGTPDWQCVGLTGAGDEPWLAQNDNMGAVNGGS